MDQDRNKRRAARAAVELVPAGCVLGVGTGSTTNHFIAALAASRVALRGAVASSEATAARLRAEGIPLLDLNEVESLPLYVDGADEATRTRWLIKGGGGALTREKIVAAASDRFVCILDQSKLVDPLGTFPLAIEVIPLARELVRREVARFGGEAILREGFVTDNGNEILDVHGLDLQRGPEVETGLDHIPGIVANGLFCRRPADLLLVGTAAGVQRL